MKIKKASKYIPQQTIKDMKNELHGVDLLLFDLLHKTGIRISEVKEYVNNWHPNKPVKMTPAKHNWDRLLPNLFDSYDMEVLTSVSLDEGALKKRICKWGYDYSPHDFRATWVSNALAKEVSPLKVQQLGGWKDLDSVMKYARITTENDLWIYDLISSPVEEWRKSDDIMFLKQQLALLTKQNEKMKFKLEASHERKAK